MDSLLIISSCSIPLSIWYLHNNFRYFSQVYFPTSIIKIKMLILKRYENSRLNSTWAHFWSYCCERSLGSYCFNLNPVSSEQSSNLVSSSSRKTTPDILFVDFTDGTEVIHSASRTAASTTLLRSQPAAFRISPLFPSLV